MYLIFYFQIPSEVGKITQGKFPEMIKKNIKWLDNCVTLLLSKNPMSGGTMFQDYKMPKMHLKKLLSCLSGSHKYLKAQENHGLEYCFMALQVQAKHF